MKSVTLNKKEHWIPHHIYVTGFPLSRCGWNGLYVLREETTPIYYELVDLSMLLGYVKIDPTIIVRDGDHWLMQRKDNNRVVRRQYLPAQCSAELLKCGYNDGATPLGAWEKGIYVDYEFMPQHIFAQRQLMEVVVLMFCSAVCFYLGMLYSSIKEF